MELQTIFNMTIQHMLRQDKASINEDDDTMCMYRGSGGTKCAVGYLISDQHYADCLEELPYDEPLVTEAVCDTLRLDELSTDQLRLLANLQSLHDRHYQKMLEHPPVYAEKFVKGVQAIATSFELILPRAVNDYIAKKVDDYYIAESM